MFQNPRIAVENDSVFKKGRSIMGIFESLEALSELLEDDEEFSPDFELVNNTDYAFHEIYVSESDSEDWEEDILDEDVLESGQTLNISFDTDSRQRYWDLRIVDEEDDETIFEHFDLSRIRKITVFYEDGEMQAEYEY